MEVITAGPFLATVGFILASAMIDAEHINKEEYIDDHSDRWFLRSLFFVSIACYSTSDGIAAALLFTALFDHLLNYFIYKPFLYLGTVAKWDVFFSRKYFMTPVIKWKTKTFLKTRSVNFNFKGVYITMKILTLLLSLYLFYI